VKETAQGKSSLLADIDFMDITPRTETLGHVAGAPVMLQLGTSPAYALTVGLEPTAGSG